MSDAEINIYIAEAVGWTNIRQLYDDMHLEWFGDPPGGSEELVPNYCNDPCPWFEDGGLHGWIEEQGLAEDWAKNLPEAHPGLLGKTPVSSYKYRAAIATPRQRTEALVAVLEGKRRR